MTGGQDWAAELISTSGGRGMSESDPTRELRRRITDVLEANWDVTKYCNELKAECDRLKKANETLVRGIDNLRADNRKLWDEVDRLRRKNATVHGCQSHGQGIIDRLRGYLDSLEHEARDNSPCGKEVSE